MKKLMIILFLCSTIQIYAQNIGPTRHEFTIRGTSVNLSDTNLDDFRQTEFLMGWHCNSFWAYDRAVRANQKDIFSTDIDRINNNTNLFVKPAGDWSPTIYTHCWGPEVLNCRGMEYEPTLLKTDENATRGEMIFGFKNIRGRVINDTNDENYGRLILDGDSLQNVVVLHFIKINH